MQRPYSAQRCTDKSCCPAEKKLKDHNLKKSQKKYESHLDNLLFANKDYFDHISCKTFQTNFYSFYQKNVFAQFAPVDFINVMETILNQILNKTTKQLIINIIHIIKKELNLYQRLTFNLNYEILQTAYQRPSTAIPSVARKDDYSQYKGTLPFTSTTHYQDEFQKLPESKVKPIEPQTNQTVLREMPFTGNSCYNKDYAPKIGGQGDKEIERLLNNARVSKFKSPIGSDLPFMATTTSRTAFLPYKTFTYNKAGFHSRPSLKYPPYAQQYTTQYKYDYYEKDKKDCPASYYEKTKND